MIIKGCRQCGKTYSVRDFAKKYYKHEIYLNFFKNPNYLSIFDGSLEINNLIMLISATLDHSAIFENLIADIFAKMGRKIYFYHKDSGLEIDFVIRYKGKATLIEVKSTTGNAKNIKTILSHPEKYHVTNAIKLGDYNIGRSDNVLIIPLYMAFLLKDY